MPVDAYIKFVPASPFASDATKILGESMDEFYKGKDFFEIKDFSFGIENKSTLGSATGGAGGGKVQFNEFTIKKTTDQSSPNFFKNCCSGMHYETVLLAIRKAGADPTMTGRPYLVYAFGTVFTTKIDWSGPGDEGPEEGITFAFGALQVCYRKQEKTGAMGTWKKVEWDQMGNKAQIDPYPNVDEVS